MNNKKKGPGNSAFDPFSEHIYDCLDKGIAISAIYADLLTRGCPHRKYKTLWQWIDKRAKGYRRRTFVGLGAKQAAPDVIITPQPPVTKTTLKTATQAEADLARQARKAARQQGTAIDFRSFGTDPITTKNQ